MNHILSFADSLYRYKTHTVTNKIFPTLLQHRTIIQYIYTACNKLQNRNPTLLVIIPTSHTANKVKYFINWKQSHNPHFSTHFLFVCLGLNYSASLYQSMLLQEENQVDTCYGWIVTYCI